MEKDYWDNLTHYVFLATAITLFVVSFKGIGKIAVGKWGPSGLQEVMAQ